MRGALIGVFAGMGISASAVPAMLALAEEELGDGVGAAIPALFFGLLLGVLTSSPVLARVRALKLAAVACFIQAAGLVAVSAALNAHTFAAAAAVVGFGFGLAEASGSVAAKAAAHGSSTRALTLLTAVVAIAAGVTPLAIAAAAHLGEVAAGLLGLAVLLAVAGVFSFLAQSPAPSTPAHRIKLPVRSVRSILPFVLALPIYVGVETMLAGWSSLFPAAIAEVPPAVAAFGTSIFWILMAVGRMLGSLWSGRAQRQILGASSIAVAATLLLGASLTRDFSPAACLVALALATVALAPTYGVVLGFALDQLNSVEAARATGVMVAVGAAGGAFIPAAVLWTGQDIGSAQTLLITGVLCAAVAVIIAPWQRKRVSEASPLTAKSDTWK